MSTYPVKKKHIYAYRRRKRARTHIDKLDKIIDVSSTKDLKRLLTPVDALGWKIRVRLGWFDDLKRDETTRKTRLEKKIESGESRLAEAAAQYICPVCQRKGYLCSPDLDREKVDLYVLHILWEEQGVHICHLGKTKRNQILIVDRPREGILTLL